MHRSGPTAEIVPRKRWVRLTSLVGVSTVTLGLVGGPITSARASTGTFRQNTSINIPSSGSDGRGSVYPSEVNVSSTCARVTDVDVLLRLTHTVPADLDILLVGPNDQNLIVMSDAGSVFAASDVTFTLDDEAATGVTSPLADGSTYKPTNQDGADGDTFPGPAPSPSTATSLSVFDGINPAGTWRLFVNDDFPSADGGTIFVWGVTITSTRASETCIPGGAASSGPAAPYPDTTTISGMMGTITDVNLTFTGLSHTFPDDLDILLVGPGGRNAFVIGDAGFKFPLDAATLTLDDEASGPLSDSGAITPGSSYQPANHSDGVDIDSFDPPAPTPSGGSALSIFDGTVPNGSWSLFVDDDGEGEVGRINDWNLQITTTGAPGINPSNAKAKEGKPLTFNVGLSAAPTLPYSVPFTTVAGSAKRGKDFKAASGNLTFAPGETSKTVVVKTRNDRRDEKNETFSLQLTAATGNVLLPARIKDND